MMTFGVAVVALTRLILVMLTTIGVIPVRLLTICIAVIALMRLILILLTTTVGVVVVATIGVVVVACTA